MGSGHLRARELQTGALAYRFNRLLDPHTPSKRVFRVASAEADDRNHHFDGVKMVTIER